MAVIFSYIDKDDTAAQYYTTQEQDEVIELAPHVKSFMIINAGDGDMYIVTEPGGAKHYLDAGEGLEIKPDTVLYSVQIVGAAGQKVRYVGARG